MSSAMELSRESLETIGSFVRRNLPTWLEQIDQSGRRNWELQLTERIVRVEEELKAQRELMQQGFAVMDKRFEDLIHQIDKRFEQVDGRFAQIDRRFSTVQWTIGIGFTVITVLMSLYNFVG